VTTETVDFNNRSPAARKLLSPSRIKIVKSVNLVIVRRNSEIDER